MNWFSSPRVSLRSRLLLHRRQAWPSLSRRCNRGSQLGRGKRGNGAGHSARLVDSSSLLQPVNFPFFLQLPPCADLSLSRARSLPKKNCTRSFLCYRSTLRSVAKHMLTNHPRRRLATVETCEAKRDTRSGDAISSRKGSRLRDTPLARTVHWQPRLGLHVQVFRPRLEQCRSTASLRSKRERKKKLCTRQRRNSKFRRAQDSTQTMWCKNEADATLRRKSTERGSRVGKVNPRHSSACQRRWQGKDVGKIAKRQTTKRTMLTNKTLGYAATCTINTSDSLSITVKL